MLVPTKVARRPNVPLVALGETYPEAHECTDAGCARCRATRGFLGRLRKGSKKPLPPSDRHAWTTKYMFTRSGGEETTWICVRPRSWGGAWAFGCWPCNAAGKNTPFGRLEVNDITSCQPSVLDKHSTSASHRDAVSVGSSDQTAETKGDGIVSGIGIDVPRLEKWVLACSVVRNHDSFCDFVRTADVQAVGSDLRQGSDSSRQAVAKMVTVMSEVIRRQDQKAYASAYKVSLAFDERDQSLLVFCRTLTTRGEIRESLLGIARDHGTGHTAAMKALQGMVNDACTLKRGRRQPGKHDVGPADIVDSDMLATFRGAVRCAAADGGNSEAKALWECSPRAKTDECKADPYFKNLHYIFRDAPHKHRSVQKNFWDHLEKPLKDFLDVLVTGDRSLLKLIEQSRKFSLIFEKCQRAVPVEARAFGNILRSFGYAEQRFNSRSEPFFKLFLLLPTAIDALAELGDSWSISILNTLGGAHGYDLVVSAALVADVMMFIQPCIREEDTDNGDASHLGSTACKIRDGLHAMLELGTIWLKESEGSCVHAALQAIKGRVVFFRDSEGEKKCTALGWPGPADTKRLAPVRRAKELYKIYMSFFDSTFPMWDVQNGFAAFDLQSSLTLPQRRVLLESLADQLMRSPRMCTRARKHASSPNVCHSYLYTRVAFTC